MNLKSLVYTKKEWESEFFGINYYGIEFLEKVDEGEFEAQLATFIEKVDFTLVECSLDISYINYAKILEQYGFQLIDSRITFITLINAEDKTFDYPNVYSDYLIRNELPEDKDSIIHLTHRYLTNNSGFISRYKDLNYFEEKDAEKYFETWINYCLNKESTHTAVAIYEDEVVGFFIFEEKENQGDTPLYKGILCAVENAHQGKKLHLSMQSFLFKQFEQKEFYLDNTTQLSNYPVVKNHIRSMRRLDKMSLTFILKK